MFTDEAMDGFRAAFQHGNMDTLRQILTPGMLEWTQFMLEYRFGVKSGLTREEYGKGFEKFEPFIPMITIPVKGDISKMDQRQLIAAAADYHANNQHWIDWEAWMNLSLLNPVAVDASNSQDPKTWCYSKLILRICHYL